MADDTSNASAAPIGTDAQPDNSGATNPQIAGSDSTLDTNGASDNPSTPSPDQAPDPQAAAPQTPQPQQDQSQPQPGDQQPKAPQLDQAAQQAKSIEDIKTTAAVAKASRFNQVAEALAGGARYKETIDPNTGTMVRTKIPLSRADIGMAIAMEAITGALSGLTQTGPGATGKAAAAGFQQVAGDQQQANKQQDQEANANFQRHAQVLDTNLKMHQLAMSAGRASFEQNEQVVGGFKPMADMMMKDHPDQVRGVVNEEDLSKYHVTKDQGIPYKTVPVLNPPGTPHAGEQAVNSYGEPRWQSSYLILNPDFKSGSLLSEDDKDEARKFNLSGFVDGDGKAVKLPQDLSMTTSMAVGLKAKLASLRLGEQDLNDFYTKLNAHNANGQQPNNVFTMFGTKENGQPDFDKLADFITKQEGTKPTDRNARNNNPGNLVADKSWTGSTDSANLAPEQKNVGYRVYGTPEEGRAGLIHQLQLDYQRMPNASPEAYFKKYDATNPAAYAANARKAAGTPEPTPSENPHPPVDLVAAVKADPTLPDALGKFQPYLNASSDNYEKAIGALGAKDPQAAAKVLSLYGGTSAVRQFDLKTTQEVAQAKTAQKLAQDTAEEDIKASAAGKAEDARLASKAKATEEHAAQLVKGAGDEPPAADGTRPNFIGQIKQSNPTQIPLLQALATGDQKLTTQGLSRPQMADLAAQAQAAYPNLSQATVNDYYDLTKQLQVTKPADAANTAMQHLADFWSTVDKEGVRATFGPLNSFESNYGSKEHQSNVNMYNQAITRAASEVEAAYKNGGASLTDKDKADAHEMFGKGGGGFMGATPSKQKSMAERAMDLLTAKYSSVDGRLADNMPSSETPIQDLMTKEAHAAYRMTHNGQDFDSAAAQRENKTKYGTWYGRRTLDQIKASNGGQAGNGQPQGMTNGQNGSKPATQAAPAAAPATPQYSHLSASGDYGWDGKAWQKIQKPAAPQQ